MQANAQATSHPISWWDETHTKVLIVAGNVKKLGDQKVEVKFIRDKHSNIEIVKRDYSETCAKKIPVKYTDEV